jgi:hypothetical protein
MAKFGPDQRIKCPYCKTAVRLEAPTHADWGQYWGTLSSPQYTIQVTFAQCPQCLHIIITAEDLQGAAGRGYESIAERLLWPLSSMREPVPHEIPDHIAGDYTEAALVIPFSPKASAALSRRCLQIILREAGNTKTKDLNDQIEEVLPTLPTNIAKNLDAVRVVGNFAAHPLKSQTTGEIIDVEPGEAEWNLDVIDALFDYYYVRPVLEQKKRDDLNQKLKDAGKPPLKE